MVSPKKIADLVLEGFNDYRCQFNAITCSAKSRFESADWNAVQQAAMERIELYDEFALAMVCKIQEFISPDSYPLARWQKVREHFLDYLDGRPDFDLAQTWFNTLFRKLYGGAYLNNLNAFVADPFISGPVTSEPVTSDSSFSETGLSLQLYESFGPSSRLDSLLTSVVDAYSFSIAFENKEQDIRKMIDVMKLSIPLLRSPQMVSLDMLKTVFYRNKGAYLIGRMMIGDHLFPVAIPILNTEAGLYVDTIIWNENDLSLIFSFTRSYFMADMDCPNEMVKFLQELLPHKKRSELYSSLGFYKHGKTEFYRGFLDHLDESEDQFVIAKGIPGLVMMVFTLPSYEVVFKVMRDRFSPTKKVTRQQVRDSYYLVKTHDRVGRMADTQEFSNFVFPRDRFSPELVEELLKAAPSSVELTEDKITLKHLYSERLMTPLNLYIEDKSDYVLKQALEEYGNAIKELAATNIFPGDMLLKNFGVTRHGRVVFYDYDEICYLTQVNFRKIPEPRYPEDELAAEPWYSVGPNDVFPEEFRIFLFNSEKQRQIFSEMHGEIFEAGFWQEMQQSIRDDQVTDVFPYRRKKRFIHAAQN